MHGEFNMEIVFPLLQIVMFFVGALSGAIFWLPVVLS